MITLLLLGSLCEAKRTSLFSSKAYDVAYRKLESQEKTTNEQLANYRTEASKVKSADKEELIEKIQELPQDAEQYVEIELATEAENLARSKDLKDSESLKRAGQKYIKTIKDDVTRLIAAINKHAARRTK